MKRFNLITFFALLAFCFTTLVSKACSKPPVFQQDSLSAYTGKYQMQQGMQTIYADVYIDKGKLRAKASTGGLLILDHISKDDFTIADQHLAVKFIRDKDDKVFEISINGVVTWTRARNPLPENPKNPTAFIPASYVGLYQLTAGGQTLKIEVSLKNGHLWATQLWDGGSSALDFVSADNFIVNALSLPVKFTRDKDNQVTQLLFNNHDLFIRGKN